MSQATSTRPPVPEEGLPRNAGATGQDGSGAPGFEERYRRIVENSPTLILELDADTGEILTCNPAMAQSLGGTVRDIEGRNVREFLPPEILESRIARVRAAVESSRVVTFEDQRNGRYFRHIVVPLRGGDRNLVQAIASDITEFRRTEEALRRALEEKTHLMQELNHRIKNNLILVSSLVRLKARSIGPAADLSDLLRQIEAIQLLHDRLRPSETPETIEVGSYLEEILGKVLSTYGGRIVNVERRVADLRLPTKAAIPLGLIVNEIATNSIKHGFTPARADFSLTLERVPGAGECRLVLSNSGAPIPEIVSLENPSSTGLRLISLLVLQLQGSVEMTRSPHPVFEIRFPAPREETGPSEAPGGGEP